ncbi:preprotein translocase subunit YajC [Eisenbergiella sp.]
MGILASEAAAAAGPGSMIGVILMYVVIFGAFFYFVMYRPQKKEQKKMSAMLSSLEIGDSILTNSGFYGVVIDITDDTVIVEFGNNKNCRIPMQKSAIAQVEKANADE